MQHKYIRHSTIGFILWPMRLGDESEGNLWHLHAAEQSRRICGGKIVSAGFCEFMDGKAFCFGESESLGMRSLPEDTKLLNEQLGTGE